MPGRSHGRPNPSASSTRRSSSGRTCPSSTPEHGRADTDTNTNDVKDARERARIAAQAAAAKKGEDIVVLDVGEILGITDAFVIAAGSNTRQVRTIVDEVEKQLREQAAVKPRAVEGLDDATWVLLDYGDVVVHVFLHETREFYGLERLWADAARIPWNGAGVTI